MQIRYMLITLMLVSQLPLSAQQNDSIKSVVLKGVTVTSTSFKEKSNLSSALAVDVAEKDFLDEHFTGNLTQALEHIPGVRSMDIGAGFSKPMIRGMAFNRISVAENGVKQEGQQWGSDHGLEIDAFNVERVTVRKGPSSLLYGSDAMGGVIEILPLPPMLENKVFGELSLLGKSVNETLGASLMLGFKKDAWYVKARYSEQQFGDYRVPTDTIVYLTQRIPVYGRKLKNTAGVERNVNVYTAYRKGRYSSNYTLSNAYQKVGFFPGAHGIPDASLVQDDGDDRNIGMPYSRVNHFKLLSQQQYLWDKLKLTWDAGYQYNLREEWSLFHTHYGTQLPPEKDPDKELEFKLHTYSSAVKFYLNNSSAWDYVWGWDVQYQQNRIAGYSFLLPRYNRFTTGVFGLANWKVSQSLTWSGGLRYDYGKVDISSFLDSYLEAYLEDNGSSQEVIDSYKWRSYGVDRSFSDLSGSVGLVWKPAPAHILKANVGHSFRLPGANELASNGVHHGTFRHEQGDPNLHSEKGWQLDVSYSFDKPGLSVHVTPYITWFSNYIFLSPTGEWSILPHAGQIYRYTEAEATFMGVELAVEYDITHWLNYNFSGEYVSTSNRDEHTALSFSPPASMRNRFTWRGSAHQLYAELHSIASQSDVAKNEAETGGAHLLHAGGSISLSLGRMKPEVGLTARNLLNKKYFNHLSYYRKVEIPEPGRNFQLFIKLPF